MPKPSPTPKRMPPPALRQYYQDQFQRTVQLTEGAIAQLEAVGETVTLEALCAQTRRIDEQGKGLKPMTVLRNPKAAELFHQHSPAYLARQQRVRKVQRNRSKAKPSSTTTSRYRGLRAADLIQIIEALQTQIGELKAQQEKCKAERNEAYHLRDEALQQNARQLVALTEMRREALAKTKVR